MIELLYGENNFAIADRVSQSVRNFREQYGDDAVTQVDADTAEWPEIHQAIEGISLFGGEEKLVVIRSTGDNKDNAQRLATTLEHISDSTELLYVEPAIDKRSALYKSAKKHGAITEFPQLDEGRLVGWLQSRAEESGGQISHSAARKLIDYVGTDQLLLDNELEKLITFRLSVDEEAIEQLVEPRASETIFQLLDTMMLSLIHI